MYTFSDISPASLKHWTGGTLLLLLLLLLSAEISILRLSARQRGDEREARVCLSAQAGECRGGRHQPPLCWGWGEAPELRRNGYQNAAFFE
jgi:hypothetical protein